MSRNFVLIADRFLMLEAFHEVRDRSWGIVGMLGFAVGMGICFLIIPEYLDISTAYSKFGGDVRTAPFFSGSIFFVAYGFWRWRRYLEQTFKRPGVATLLLTIAIIGLYLVALLPVTVEGTSEALHVVGFSLVGLSMTLMVAADIILRKIESSPDMIAWQILRFSSLLAITVGLATTAISVSRPDIFDVKLLGESLIFLGFLTWVVIKTYRGEGTPNKLSVMINKILIIK